MYIFLSHSVKDKEIADIFKDFLCNLSVEVEVFYSSNPGMIEQGTDFVQSIEEALKNCEIFIPLLSENYLSSKYCMIELGYAYSRLVNRRKKYQIFPFSIPPILPSQALLGTPLSRLQTVELNQAEGIYEMVRLLKRKNYLSNIRMTNIELLNFVDNINSAIMQAKNILSGAVLLPICSSLNNPDAIQCSKEDNSYIVNFNLYANGLNERPDFLSTVLSFPAKFNLYNYLCTNANLRFYCVIDNYTNSLTEISIEFKYHETHQLLKKYFFPLHEGKNNIQIPIKEMNVDGLKQISEICFVTWSNSFIEIEGMYRIENIQVK